MSKLVNPHWPDEVRLKMIEKSEFYSEPQIYQYGFYDGFQHDQSQTQELIEQNAELVEAVWYLYNFSKGMHFHEGSKTDKEISELLTKYNHLKSNTNGNNIE